MEGIAELLVAGGTIVLAIWAIFGNKICAWVTRPKLDVAIDVKPPDCLKIPITQSVGGVALEGAESYYLRCRVINRGNRKAESVEVFVARLERQQADGSFKEVDSFLPMNLLWANCSEVFFPAILPDMYRHCGLAHIIDPEKRRSVSAEDKAFSNVSSDKTILSLETEVKPNTMSYLLPVGRYRLVIWVAAANANRIERTLEISLTGEWFDDEKKMLGDGIGVRILRSY